MHGYGTGRERIGCDCAGYAEPCDTKETVCKIYFVWSTLTHRM